MTLTVLLALLQIGQATRDPMSILQETFDRRSKLNACVAVTIHREETKTDGVGVKTVLHLKHCKFEEYEYCEMTNDSSGIQLHRKVCRGCYAPDKDRVLMNRLGEEEMFLVRSSKEAANEHMLFDLRMLGFYSFFPEMIDAAYPRPYSLEIYDRPIFNEQRSLGDVICIEVPLKTKMGSMRYFINNKLKRIEKVTIENSALKLSSTIESVYSKDADFFPMKIKKSSVNAHSRRGEEIEITEARILTKKSDIDWGPQLVNFRPNIFVVGMLLRQNSPVQHGFFYDGRIIREPTKKDYDDYGQKIEPNDTIPKDNLRNNDRSLFLYLIPIALFSVAAVLLIRHWRKKSST
jgi:hypothetical protein